jgi:predicted DNA-binding transcriptional regulator
MIKEIEKEIKNLIDYGNEFFEKDGKSFLFLESKIKRNESYAITIMYLARIFFQQKRGVTITEISNNLVLDEGNVRKIISLFFSSGILTKHKIGRKCLYGANYDPEKLEEFKILLERAKETKNKINTEKNE